MQATIKSAHLLALIVWVGEIVFFSFVGAPAIFRNLPVADAGRVAAGIFHLYYLIGYVCGAVLLLTTWLLRRDALAGTAWNVSAGLAALMLAATLYAGLVVQPRAAALRPQLHDSSAPPGVREQFDRLHRLAVQLNASVLLCGLAVSIITARALRP